VARRSGLGRGLGSLIPTEAIGQRGSALQEVPVGSIRANALQPRSHFDEEAMSSLAASIREVGVLQPILVRELGEGEYELIAGERRWRAARRAGLQTIPVIIQTISDSSSLEHALVENLHRADLNPLEEAAAFHQLIDDFGYTHEQVATRVGRSRTAVTNTLRLLQLPAGVQRYIADGQLTAGHARALLTTPDRAFQEELAKRIQVDGLSVRAVEVEIRAHDEPAMGSGIGSLDELAGSISDSDGAGTEKSRPAGQARTVTRLPAPGVLELEELLSAHLNTRVKVEMRAKRGRVVVDFATLEDLERIYRLIVANGSVVATYRE
jgi:ParB family transcriptional regulator, chromosome partitioning protein